MALSAARRQEILASAGYGVEPRADDVDHTRDNYTADLMRALGWYNYEKDYKTALGYMRAWVRQHRGAAATKAWDALPSYPGQTWGWLARMDMQGARLSPEHRARIARTLDDYLSLAQVSEPEPEAQSEPENTAPRRSIQDIMAEKQAEFLGELEGFMDDFITNDCRGAEDLFKFLQARNAARQYAQAWAEVCEGRLAELQEIDSCEQLQEGYGNFTQAQLRRFIAWLQQQIEDCGRYVGFKRANRKAPAKRVKPAGVQVAKMRYCAEFSELGLRSVSPTSVVGAQQLWVYNTKNKKLGVYYATGAAGFTVKGTSLQGWDSDTSVQRTLRKPAEVINKTLEAGKVALRRILTDLTTTETKLTGRFNEDIILLRVV